MKKLTEGLNEAQRRAVLSDAPRILCIAGAGTGKTGVLTRRVARLLKQGVAPSRILCVTFTRKAAAEMKERIQRFSGARYLPEIRTLHSWSGHLLRIFPEYFGRTREFTVYDEVDREDVIRACARDLGNKMWARSRLPTLWKDERVQRLYEERLLEGNAFDFDMLEECALNLLTNNERARKEWTGRYSHVMVDEYQDTNLAQVAIVNGLFPQNLFIVGDPKQCQPAGTMVATPTGQRPIEDIYDDDLVKGWSRRSKFVGGQRKVKTACRPYTGMMFTITTSSGKKTTCTDAHKWATRWAEEARELHAVYVMRREFHGTVFRVGWCKVIAENQGYKSHHYKQRARLEKADGIWLLEVMKSRADASALESIVSVNYGIPTVMFEASSSTVLYTQNVLDRVWSECGPSSRSGMTRIIQDYNLHGAHPIWSPETKGGRQTIFECVAANLRVGMALPVWDGGRKYNWETITSIEVKHVVGVPVYSLDIDVDHAYVADGICTLNSIYRFRGAVPATIVEHAQDADFEVIQLTVNYRSLQRIVTMANGAVSGDWEPMTSARSTPIISKVVQLGRSSSSFIELGLLDGYLVDDNPAAVVSIVKEEIEVGNRVGDIAVLGRTWSALRAVYDALLNEGIEARYYGGETDCWKTEDGRQLARMLLLMRNPADDNLAAFLANWGCLGYPRISDVQALRAEALMERRSLFKTLAGHSKAWNKLLNACVVFKIEDRTPKAIAHSIIVGWLLREKYASLELHTRNITLTSCVDALEEFDTLDEFADWWTDRSTADRVREESGVNAVHILTVHAAKGLEWPTVIGIDCRDGAYPSNRKSATLEDREEDLRVWYVMVTRARDRLALVCPTGHTPPWKKYPEPCNPSPFLALDGAPELEVITDDQIPTR